MTECLLLRHHLFVVCVAAVVLEFIKLLVFLMMLLPSVFVTRNHQNYKIHSFYCD